MKTLRFVISLVIVTIALPVLSAAQGDGPDHVGIAGFPLSLSPDGAWIAGVHEDGARVCVWDTGSLTSRCDSELPAPMEPRSLAWAPDGSAVAFSLGADNRLVDSDVYVFEVASGTLHNLTEDDPQGTDADAVSFLVPQEEPVAIDQFPAWSPDGSTLLFARTMWGDPGAPGVTLMTIPREGGEPETHATLNGTAPLAVAGPMIWREDGSVLLTTRHPDPTSVSNAIRLLDADGAVTTLVDGSVRGPIPEPMLASVGKDGTAVSAWSRLDFHEGLWTEGTPVFFHVDVATGAVTPWAEMPGVRLPEGARLIAPPVFGPEGAVAFLWWMQAGAMGLSVLDATGEYREVAPVAYAGGGPAPWGISAVDPALHWADDGTLLVVLDTGGLLVTAVPVDATPVTSPAGSFHGTTPASSLLCGVPHNTEVLTMDMFKDKANDLMNSGVADQLKDIDFPASKDEILRQLEQKGVPGPVIDKVRNVDTSRFENFEDFRAKVGL